MAYEQKDGQFTVWKNEKYTQGGNQPYARGKGKDDQGREVEVTLWIPNSDKIKGFNLTIGKPYQSQGQAEVIPPAQQTSNDLPF